MESRATRWLRPLTRRSILPSRRAGIVLHPPASARRFPPAADVSLGRKMSSSPATGNSPGKANARAASVHIDAACNAFMNDCFKQFGIHVVALPGDPAAVFSRQKFEACILRLYDPDAERILKAARCSS